MGSGALLHNQMYQCFCTSVHTPRGRGDKGLQVDSGHIVLSSEFFKNVQFSKLFYLLELQVRDGGSAWPGLSLLFIASVISQTNLP